MRNRTRLLRTLAIAFSSILLTANLAHAHADGSVPHDHSIFDGLSHGFSHPWFGLDHLLAMVAIGVWATQLKGRAVWAVPLGFLGMMAAGAGFAQFGGQFPGAETAILGSNVILGLMIMSMLRLPVGVSAALAGVLAIAHGYAHGSEMPADVSGLGYGIGFLVATAMLHAVGLGLGVTITRLSQANQRLAFRFAGGLVLLGTLYVAIA
jgi:urease accessory protein